MFTITFKGCGLLDSWVEGSVADTFMLNWPPTFTGGWSVMTPVLALTEAHDGALARLYRSSSPAGPVAVAVNVADWPPVTVRDGSAAQRRAQPVYSPSRRRAARCWSPW